MKQDKENNEKRVKELLDKLDKSLKPARMTKKQKKKHFELFYDRNYFNEEMPKRGSGEEYSILPPSENRNI